VSFLPSFVTRLTVSVLGTAGAAAIFIQVLRRYSIEWEQFFDICVDSQKVEA